MSYAGLQENAAQDMHVMCSGGASFYGHFFACDKRHGMVDIEHAIPWSCDTFYYTLANKLGIDTIAKYATDLGFSQRTGVDLPDEVTGTMPSTAWKMKNFHEKWYAGEVISVGIGQGAVAVTPIQLARAIGGVASGGALKRPHLVFPDEVPSEELEAIHETFPGSGDKTVPLATANWQLITDAMAATTTSGTAAPAHMEGIDFAGKTGTAQVVSHSAGMTSLGVGKERANAWFVGMAPRRNPDIAVAVLWEHGGWGAGSAPVAAQIINAFVTKQRKRENNIKIAEKPAAVVDQTAATPPATVPAAAAGTIN
jgi:penicillin-binding protein 2